MTTPARNAEADRVELVYHWALVQIGASSVEEAIALWQNVPASEQAATSADWLAEAIQMVMLYRGWSRDLALAYYRLARALRTGSTIADPRKPEPEYVTLEMLRQEFEALVDEIEPPSSSPSSGTGEAFPDDENEPAEPPEYDDADYDDNDKILVEEIAELEALIERQDREAEQQAAELLDQLGIENMLKKLDEIDTDGPAVEVDQARDVAHRQAGARQAAIAEMLTLNAARSLVYDVSEYDGRVLGYARFSQTGTPCGWCAMLISRGAVYRSRQSAEQKSEGGTYHPNCHCVAIPLFTLEQFDNSDLFALNREYGELWPKVTQGLGGDAAVSAWRKYIRQTQRAQRAQAAAERAQT